MTVTRGTTNGNDRGNNADRRRRREWLVEAYRADTDEVIWVTEGDGGYETVPACRCYRCGILLTVDTVTVDRIVPGCLGGTYAHNNIRPACSNCNTETGAGLANAKHLRVAKMKARILKKACDYCYAPPGKRCFNPLTHRSLSTFHAPRRAAA